MINGLQCNGGIQDISNVRSTRRCYLIRKFKAECEACTTSTWTRRFSPVAPELPETCAPLNRETAGQRACRAHTTRALHREGPTKTYLSYLHSLSLCGQAVAPRQCHPYSTCRVQRENTRARTHIPQTARNMSKVGNYFRWLLECRGKTISPPAVASPRKTLPFPIGVEPEQVMTPFTQL